jgi:hypothetical protein
MIENLKLTLKCQQVLSELSVSNELTEFAQAKGMNLNIS